MFPGLSLRFDVGCIMAALWALIIAQEVYFFLHKNSTGKGEKTAKILPDGKWEFYTEPDSKLRFRLT